MSSAWSSLARFAGLLSVLVALSASGSAVADTYLPPSGKVFAGVAMGSSVRDFQRRTGQHPAVWEQFIRWHGSFRWALDWARAAHTRSMHAIGTSRGQNMPESISPGPIARGQGDRWILWLTRVIAREDRPVYIRLMAEMNNC